MINFYNQVPSVYTSASRDFQYLSWLINIVLNSVKHNIDYMYNLPSIGGNPKLTELLAMTLGFKVKRNYDEKQLMALAAVLPSILKYKGTEKAINMAATALVKAGGSLGEANVDINGTEVIVTLPRDLVDVTLFLDLLDYILPAGMTCRISRENIESRDISDIQVKYSDALNLIVADDLSWKSVGDDSQSTGLSSLFAFEDGQSIVDYSSNIKVLKDGSVKLNAGLLSNTVIPTLAKSDLVDGPANTVILSSMESDGSCKKLCAESDDVVLQAKKVVHEL